ncbi:riboflavin synthase [Candidatus Peregrinibacteria bacterium]|nr:riboflavin synthase [Candidatus Peregrinibacteria bacterium]
MFTGIIQTTGTVKEIGKEQLTIESEALSGKLSMGCSVAVNGACLTVVAFKDGTFTMDVMPETFHKTNLGLLNAKDQVNLELAMPADGRFEGHMVLGHVEGVGEIKEIRDEGNSKILTIQAPMGIDQFLVEKGSVAIDGISLTVIEVHGSQFTVGIIPHTWEQTHLHTIGVGDKVNLETDIVAKYLKKLVPGGQKLE